MSETAHKLETPISVLIRRRNAFFKEMEKGRADGFLAAHAQILDDYFRESFERSEVGPRMRVDKNPYAVVALGGYGRREQCAHSDVDLLLLFEKRIPPDAAGLVQEIVYPLWDAGLEVGYATRTIAETAQLASADFEVLTSLVDARFICGMSFLYMDLAEILQEKVLRARSKAYVKWLVDGSEKRHERYGDSASLLEPNLKEGQGGLRDYHFIRWAAAALYGAREPRDLEYLGILSHDEYDELSQALDFIWLVRNRVHLLCGRKCDQLHFEYQRQVADSLGFARHGNLEGVELFLKTLHGHMECVKESRKVLLWSAMPARRRFSVRRGLKSAVPGLRIEKDALNFDSPEAIVENPRILIQIFVESARVKMPLSVEAARLVREFSHLADAAFASDPAVVADFERILAAPAPEFNVLEKMLSTGFLARLIPEFSGIVHRIQFTEYHVFPVDKHSLRTIRTVKGFVRQEKDARFRLAAQLWREISPKKLLLWAALLHDVGKGEPGGGHDVKGARMAREIMLRMGYPEKQADTVAFLVAEHLTLVKTATRRDLNDERTAIVTARRVQDPMRLKMLYLLTVADSVATGPKAWNDWAASLVKDLFFKTHQILTQGSLASRGAMRQLEKKREEVMAAAADDRERAGTASLLEVMTPRYLNDMPAPDIADHVRLFARMGEAPAILEFSRGPGKDTRSVTVCAKDRPGLFSCIAGAFILHNLNILDAAIYTWRNHVALDVFIVNRPLDPLFEEEIAQRAERDLKKALAGELDLASAVEKKLAGRMAPRPPARTKRDKVVVDNEASAFFTIVEIHTYDRLGLLYHVTDALFRCRLDVWVAKISTKADQVVDAFYVRDFDGQKVDDERAVEEIRRTLLDVLSGESSA
ncbi:MAG: [protein-PII] uridylyltransferase [Proteobacteria bacterium]|nr:[protein-PII] uridylyltransferase [Pseudomonadota bacterium]